MFLAAGQAAGKAAGSSWDDARSAAHLRAARHDVVASRRRKGWPRPTWRGRTAADHDSAVVEADVRRRQHRTRRGDPVEREGHGAVAALSVERRRGQRQAARQLGGASRDALAADLGGGGRPADGRGGDPAARDSFPVTHFSSYGMGWFVEDYHGQLMWQHGGNTPGMTAAVGMLPEKHFGVAVLSNMQSAQLPGDRHALHLRPRARLADEGSERRGVRALSRAAASRGFGRQRRRPPSIRGTPSRRCRSTRSSGRTRTACTATRRCRSSKVSSNCTAATGTACFSTGTRTTSDGFCLRARPPVR